MTTTTTALAVALEALGDALVQARPDAIEASEALVAARVEAYRRAVAHVASGTVIAVAADTLLRLRAALARCRRLGCSLTLITGQASSVDTPRAYTPHGQPLAAAGGGAFLTARG